MSRAEIIKGLLFKPLCFKYTHHAASMGSGFLTTRNMYKTHVISLSSKFAMRILKPGNKFWIEL